MSQRLPRLPRWAFPAANKQRDIATIPDIVTNTLDIVISYVTVADKAACVDTAPGGSFADDSTSSRHVSDCHARCAGAGIGCATAGLSGDEALITSLWRCNAKK